ncbi:hypothetical protein PIB30_035382 [Stylosanthes scabra]|uniref:Uncharacterized protein n=1 Tax=Stylosanthes scabra TaxID=79078 RepID=A0ABU6YDR3_9FABA|nr:hypothetical protein [Stylosanthes scabra]
MSGTEFMEGFQSGSESEGSSSFSHYKGSADLSDSDNEGSTDCVSHGVSPHDNSLEGNEGGCREGGGNNGSFNIAKDFVGKEFASEQEALAAYKGFARMRGFGVRKEMLAA